MNENKVADVEDTKENQYDEKTQEFLQRKNIRLNEKQSTALQLMINGKNIFLTGEGGTGKSLLIHLFKERFGGSRYIAITSTTGTSALLIKGSTMHSFLGIGLGTASTESLVTKIRKKPYLRDRWRKVETLIIDEVSMLSPKLFDKIENIARRVRLNEEPFGGIQLILSGDFCQLPVVKEDKYCFEANSWERCVQHTIYLTENMRQADPLFQEVLSKVRIGCIDEQVQEVLRSRVNAPLTNDEGILPTRLFPTNAAVSEINNAELDKLAEEGREFYQYDREVIVYPYAKNKLWLVDKYTKSCSAAETLQLCVGAQVMLRVNTDFERGLVNGSRGVVVRFEEDMPVVKFLNGEEKLYDVYDWEIEEQDRKLLCIRQIPLTLCYAITIHGCQGVSLDYVEMDLKNVFEYSQAYVALSRVRTLEGLRINNIRFSKIKTHPRAKQYYRELEEGVRIEVEEEEEEEKKV